jgi:hypothetical protein
LGIYSEILKDKPQIFLLMNSQRNVLSFCISTSRKIKSAKGDVIPEKSTQIFQSEWVCEYPSVRLLLFPCR